MIQIVLSYLAIHLFSIFTGVVEAILFMYKLSFRDALRGDCSYNPTELWERYHRVKNIHNKFVYQRIGVFIIYYCVFWQATNWWVAAIGTVAGMLVYPFMHDGMYYTFMNYLVPGKYKLKWRDNSPNTSAKISFSFEIRLMLYLVSLWAMFVLLILLPTIA